MVRASFMFKQENDTVYNVNLIGISLESSGDWISENKSTNFAVRHVRSFAEITASLVLNG